VPVGAPQVQRIEMERAFHAGAFALLTTMLKMLEPGEEPTPKDERLMDDINEELHEFFGRVVSHGAKPT